ncbi:MAG: diacylglycerol kinase family protein [Desulfurobacteriaceae bacterium]
MIRTVKGIIRGINYAISGLHFALRKDRHFRINFTLSIVGTFSSLVFLSGCIALVVALANYLVLVVELLNTAIERAVDTATQEFHPLAKASKDVASAAVLSMGIFAFALDVVFLLPAIMERF